MKRGFIPNQTKGLMKYSLIKGWFNISIREYREQRNNPVNPVDINAKDTDQIFLLEGSQ